MDPVTPLVVSLSDVAACREELVGGKAAKLSRLVGSGCRVPAGFCLTVAAYETFVRDHDIEEAIRMELGRKDLDGMRWEEIWDAALRIRSLFLARPLPCRLQEALRGAVAGLGATDSLAVRSSALGEDSGDMSFAGIHESSTDVRTEDRTSRRRCGWCGPRCGPTPPCCIAGSCGSTRPSAGWPSSCSEWSTPTARGSRSEWTRVAATRIWRSSRRFPDRVVSSSTARPTRTAGRSAGTPGRSLPGDPGTGMTPRPSGSRGRCSTVTN